MKNTHKTLCAKRYTLCAILIALLCIILPQTTQAATTNQISQFAITWTFDRDYEYGQFANGDYWVVGPVRITSISPGWDGEKHGSMVNPIPADGQAYDQRLPVTFNSNKIIQAPVTLQPNSSLVSTISWLIDEPGHPELVNGKPRPTLKTAAVLTVLNTIPLNNGATVFRPPYSGNNKPLYSTSNLRKDLLPNLALVANTPDMFGLIEGQKSLERAWLDHFKHDGGDMTQYTSPTNNMPNYGRAYGIFISKASLLLMLDEQELIRQQGRNKDLLLTRFVQLGIDLYYIAKEGNSWKEGGALNQGRKWPIIFAGIMLNNEDMKNIGFSTTTFQEDLQTWYVKQEDVGREMTTYDGRLRETYLQKDVGMPEWGEGHTRSPERDDRRWGASYRGIFGMSMPGIILAAQMMGQKQAWNHDALFDYIDRWVDVHNQYYSDNEANRAYYVYGGDFQRDMWNAYRNNYGCVWTRYDPTDLYSNGSNPCNQTFLYGDVNADAEISAFDAALAAHIAVELAHPDIKNRAAAEVSGDGQVSAYDAALIAQKAVGLIDKFPVEL